MKKRLFCLILVLSLIPCAPLLPMAAPETMENDFNPLFYRAPDMTGMSGEKIVEVIDYEMAKLYPDRVSGSFYRDKASENGKIRYTWLAHDLKVYAEKYKLPFLRSPVIYDPNSRNSAGLSVDSPPDPKTDSIGTITRNYAGIGNLSIPVWGKNYYGDWYVDWGDEAAYWFEHGWSGYRLNGQYWNDTKSRKVLTYVEALSRLSAARRASYENSKFYGLEKIPGFPDHFLDELIQYGADEIWGGVKGRDIDFRNSGAYYLRSGGFIHKRGEKPIDYRGGQSAGNDAVKYIPWHKCILIMIPPTYVAWGYGIRFCADPGDDYAIYTVEIPIAPINMLLNDLKAGFIDTPASALPGDRVTMGVSMSSFFTEEQTLEYRWSIPNASGLETVYYGGAAEGEIRIPGMGIADIWVSFTMPEKGVNVRFEINPDGKVPENGNYDNNTAEHFIAPRTPPPPDTGLSSDTGLPSNTGNIPAWVLTQGVALNFISSASLTMPRVGGVWTGNAKGALDIFNESAIYNSFTVTNNPIVDEASTAITRRPHIAAVLDRADFGDDPKKGHFAENDVPLTETAAITGAGSVSRPYQYTRQRVNAAGTLYDVTSRGTEIAEFSDIDDLRAYTFDVYNGMKDLPYRKSFKNKMEKTAIENNGLTYNLAWEGTSIPFNVVRWMCHRNASNAEYGWEAVNGRYKRTFIGQSTASLAWKTGLSQAAGYQGDRDNARAGKTGQGNYSNAVFATDKSLQSIDYPIKSGYYFNPLGVYSCTVKTAQYKETDSPTEEHAELVEKVKGSFRYSSELQYMTAGRGVTKLTPVSQGNNRAVLAVNNSVTNKTAVKLETTGARTGNVDRLLAEVMEGYAASMSGDSLSEYKYQERTDKAIYLVEEETVITFTLAAPTGINMYTHVNMPNGDYVIRVWTEQFEFDGPNEKKANIVTPNSGFFDGLKVTVRGSMYDDR